jgi:hypothetical protein
METFEFGARQYPSFHFAKVDQPQPYRGFSIERLSPYYLFEIVAKDGCDVVPMLAGKYTKLSTLHSQIDEFFRLNPNVTTAEQAYVKRYVKPGRGRPKKPTLTTTIIEAPSNTNE